MRIALDLDGTAWFHVEFFVEFTKAMQKAGHEVGILTSHGVSSKRRDLQIWKYLGYPEPDFYIYKTNKDKRIYKGTEGNNGIWKAIQVQGFNIDYLFGDLDNNEKYIEAFRNIHPTKLFRVWNE